MKFGWPECAVCGKTLTQADVIAGYQRMIKGKIHTVHAECGIK